jgi:hypothetical protein
MYIKNNWIVDIFLVMISLLSMVAPAKVPVLIEIYNDSLKVCLHMFMYNDVNIIINTENIIR